METAAKPKRVAKTGQSAKQSATVRISEQSHRYLREMAAEYGEPMQAVLDKAVDQHRRQKFWDDLKTAYAAIESDPEALAEYQAELALWDCTLMDGLDPNESWTETDFCLPAKDESKDESVEGKVA